MNVADAAATGDRLVLLLAMRERIAKAVSEEDCPPRDLASLTRRLQEIAKEIAEIQERARQEAQQNGKTNGKTWDPASV